MNLIRIEREMKEMAGRNFLLFMIVGFGLGLIFSWPIKECFGLNVDENYVNAKGPDPPMDYCDFLEKIAENVGEENPCPVHY